MWICDHFSTSINIAHMGLYMIYSHSTEGASALLSNYAAVLSETVQQPRWSLHSLNVLLPPPTRRRLCDHSVCHSVNRTEQLTNADTDVDQTWQAWATDDSLEVIDFWW